MKKVAQCVYVFADFVLFRLFLFSAELKSKAGLIAGVTVGMLCLVLCIAVAVFVVMKR